MSLRPSVEWFLVHKKSLKLYAGFYPFTTPNCIFECRMICSREQNVLSRAWQPTIAPPPHNGFSQPDTAFRVYSPRPADRSVTNTTDWLPAEPLLRPTTSPPHSFPRHISNDYYYQCISLPRVVVRTSLITFLSVTFLRETLQTPTEYVLRPDCNWFQSARRSNPAPPHYLPHHRPPTATPRGFSRFFTHGKFYFFFARFPPVRLAPCAKNRISRHALRSSCCCCCTPEYCACS